MSDETSRMPDLKPIPIIAIGMSALLLVFHLVVDRQYGFHGDELYFVVCGARPAWGYVDHPPLVPMVAWLSTSIFGVTLFAVRAPVALALAAGCGLTGWLARRLGAGRFGEFLAALCFVCAPMVLRVGALLNIPSFEIVFWLVIAHLLVMLQQRDDARWWVAVGLAAGVAMLNKHTTLFLGAGMAAGLLFTPRRKDLATPWPWVGGAVAALFFLPNLTWQFQHDWATLEFVRNINASMMQTTSRVEFLLSQVILMNAFVAVVWISGLVFFFRDAAGRPHRILGWIFVAVLGILLAAQSKIYYLLPAYPLVIAGGAVLLERRLSGQLGNVARGMLCTGIAAMGLIFVPIMCPVGTLEWKEHYISRVLGFLVEDPTDLTFDFHYQLHRPEELTAFLSVYRELSPDDQRDCAVMTYEYDSASNVNVFGRALGLPQGISGNNSYYLWGPGSVSGNCIVAFDYKEDFLSGYFGEVRAVGEVPTGYRGETRPVFLCRKPKAPLSESWAYFKTYH